MRYYINQQCPDNHYPYVVQPGDTLYRIAQRLEVSLQRIIEANPGIDPNYLRVGQVICIPACPPNHTPYIIRPGDTLYRIAQMYNVTVEDILDANEIPYETVETFIDSEKLFQKTYQERLF